jgi:hypothetical protein
METVERLLHRFEGRVMTAGEAADRCLLGASTHVEPCPQQFA